MGVYLGDTSGLNHRRYDPSKTQFCSLSRYSLTEPSDWFQLHPDTGVLTALQSFDREKQASFDMRVNCTDSGLATKKWTVVDVRVLVDDVNDNAPEFRRSIYTIKVDEAGVEGKLHSRQIPALSKKPMSSNSMLSQSFTRFIRT